MEHEADSQEAAPSRSHQHVPVVEDILKTRTRGLISARVTADLTTAAKVMGKERIGVLVVVDANGSFYGVVSERDVVKCFGALGAKAADMKVGEVATRSVKACNRDTPLEAVLKAMKDGGFRHMPVVNGGKVAGVLSIGDVLGYLASLTEVNENGHRWIGILRDEPS